MGLLCSLEMGRLIFYLEDVFFDFFEFVVVGGYVGFLWIDEFKSFCICFFNFYFDILVYVFDWFLFDFVDLMKGVVCGCVFFGMNWLMLLLGCCFEGFDGLNFDDDVCGVFFGGMVKKIFSF